MKSSTETYIQQTKKLLDLQHETMQKLSSMLSSTGLETLKSEALLEAHQKMEQGSKLYFSTIHQVLELYGNVSNELQSGDTYVA